MRDAVVNLGTTRVARVERARDVHHVAWAHRDLCIRIFGTQRQRVKRLIRTVPPVLRNHSEGFPLSSFLPLPVSTHAAPHEPGLVPFQHVVAVEVRRDERHLTAASLKVGRQPVAERTDGVRKRQCTSPSLQTHARVHGRHDAQRFGPRRVRRTSRDVEHDPARIRPRFNGNLLVHGHQVVDLVHHVRDPRAFPNLHRRPLWGAKTLRALIVRVQHHPARRLFSFFVHRERPDRARGPEGCLRRRLLYR